jgi:hypothetical protein
VAARVAREGKAAGVLFDIEQYNFHLFEYGRQKRRDAKSFQEYAEQARRRGREVMRAFQDGYPGLTVFLTFGQSLPYAQLNGSTDRAKLAGVDYGLLAPFLDGMFDAAEGKATIVDGFEISYGYKAPAQFDEAVVTVKQKLLPLVADKGQYLKHVSMGFGLWMDYDWRKNGWDASDPSKNYFTPDQFQSSVRDALQRCDQYVWIYTESPRWWTNPDGKPDKLPDAYVEAVRKARRHAPGHGASAAPGSASTSRATPRQHRQGDK